MQMIKMLKKEARTVFYLAQTYSCLRKFEDSLKYYELRSTMEGFWEENFQSLLKCGELSQLLGHDWYDSMKWYIHELISEQYTK
jgi:hypothetical protein